MALTVVRPDDLADRILDRDKHPQWQGQRTKMVYAFPGNEALWARYAELWREGLRADRGIGEATEFYRLRREAMDEGAIIAWPERHHPDELSAAQHAMNLRLDRGEAAFGAEYFTLRDIRRTLATAAPRAGLEGAIYAGLERLTERTLGREWQRDDASTVRIDRCLIDANWGQSTDVVYQFCRQSPFASVLLPSHGRYVGASSIPFSEYKRKRGDRLGLNWRIPVVTGRRTVRHAVFDANYWKSFIPARLAVPMGDPGCLSLFGRQPERHRLLAEHLTSEYRVKTEGRGRTVDEWKLRVDGLDNHWLDGLVGCAVAASIAGAAVPGLPSSAPVRRRRVSLRELASRAQRLT